MDGVQDGGKYFTIWYNNVLDLLLGNVNTSMYWTMHYTLWYNNVLE